MSSHMTGFPSFLRLNNIPPYEYTPFSLSIHPLADIWVASAVGYCYSLLNPACVRLCARHWDGKRTRPGSDPQGCHSVVKEKASKGTISVESRKSDDGGKPREWHVVHICYTKLSVEEKLELD